MANLIDATEISTLEELSVQMDNDQDLDFYQSNSGHTIIYKANWHEVTSEGALVHNGNDPAVAQIVENMEGQCQGMGEMQQF